MAKAPDTKTRDWRAQQAADLVIAKYRYLHALIELREGDTVFLDARVSLRAALGRWRVLKIFQGRYLRVQRDGGSEIKQVTIEAVTGHLTAPKHRADGSVADLQAQYLWDEDPATTPGRHDREIEL